MSLFAQRLRHPTRLTVWPSDAPLFKIYPLLFERENLGHASRKLKLEPYRERDERMLQSFLVGTIEIRKEFAQRKRDFRCTLSPAF
ncbi:hypothetical protein [Nitrobacter sp.]|uniref:hypothetical protein n=1 Tax=Nitrobacter sp. TaxID=29420 RepID=UPI003F64DF84